MDWVEKGVEKCKFILAGNLSFENDARSIINQLMKGVDDFPIGVVPALLKIESEKREREKTEEEKGSFEVLGKNPPFL